jgi:hypothetical protein
MPGRIENGRGLSATHLTAAFDAQVAGQETGQIEQEAGGTKARGEGRSCNLVHRREESLPKQMAKLIGGWLNR